jgi:DNA-binding LacI/PurR family transcriptional regulator
MVAAISGPRSNPCPVRRGVGYVGAARDAGQAPIVADGDFSLATARVATHRLLREHPDVDAVFAACDVTALGVMQAVAESGRRVPDDVAVVGFDDSAWAAASTPPLSSVHQSIEEEGEVAVSMLLNQPTRARVAPPYLIVRESSRA